MPLSGTGLTSSKYFSGTSPIIAGTSKPFSISAWIYPVGSIDRSLCGVCNGAAGTTFAAALLSSTPSIFSAINRDNVNTNLQVSGAGHTLSAWNMVTGIFASSAIVNFYMNASLYSTTGGSLGTETYSQFILGAVPLMGTALGASDLIAYAALWSGTLSQSDISALYAGKDPRLLRSVGATLLRLYVPNLATNMVDYSGNGGVTLAAVGGASPTYNNTNLAPVVYHDSITIKAAVNAGQSNRATSVINRPFFGGFTFGVSSFGEPPLLTVGPIVESAVGVFGQSDIAYSVMPECTNETTNECVNYFVSSTNISSGVISAGQSDLVTAAGTLSTSAVASFGQSNPVIASVKTTISSAVTGQNPVPVAARATLNIIAAVASFGQSDIATASANLSTKAVASFGQSDRATSSNTLAMNQTISFGQSDIASIAVATSVMGAAATGQNPVPVAARSTLSNIGIVAAGQNPVPVAAIANLGTISCAIQAGQSDLVSAALRVFTLGMSASGQNPVPVEVLASISAVSCVVTGQNPLPVSASITLGISSAIQAGQSNPAYTLAGIDISCNSQAGQSNLATATDVIITAVTAARFGHARLFDMFADGRFGQSDQISATDTLAISSNSQFGQSDPFLASATVDIVCIGKFARSNPITATALIPTVTATGIMYQVPTWITSSNRIVTFDYDDRLIDA